MVLLEGCDGHITGVHSGFHVVTAIDYAKPVSLVLNKTTRSHHLVSTK